MCFPSAPQPVTRDPGAETAATLRAQREMELGVGQFADLGPRIESERRFQPQYTQLEIDRTRGALYGDQGDNGLLALMRDAGPELATINQSALSTQRAGDIADVARLAGSARSAYDQLNPEGAGLLRRINELRTEELANPYGMTASQTREAQQAVRSAQAARGLGYGPTDAFTEGMYLGDRQRGLFNERMAGAAQTIGLNQGFYGDPFLQILGRPSGSSAQGLVQQAQGFGPQQVFDPYNNYFGEAYASNANAANAARIAGANQSASMFGAGIGALGTMGGGLLGNAGLFSGGRKSPIG
jgi:hypothetical protein